MMTSPPPKFTPFSTSEKRPPLGIGFLISVLKIAGHNVHFSDEYVRLSNILKTDFLLRYKIDFVGIYSNTICLQGTLKLIKQLRSNRERGWKGKIMVGGPHTSVDPEGLPEDVDFIVIGEGERSIIEILEGVVSERIIKGKQIEDLDTLPQPAWEEFMKLPYNWEHRLIKTHPIVTLNTSRGCPFNCKFCSVCSIWGRTYRIMSAERIFNDITYLIRKYGIKGIYFREDNFTLNTKRIKTLCDLLIKNEVKIDWLCETRVDTLQDFDYVYLMAKAGCKVFYIGVESGSQRILELVNKGITINQIKKAFENAKKVGIKTYASLIYGIPSETEEDLKLTEDLIKQIKPDSVGRNIFVGIPGSELYDFVQKNQLYEYKDNNGLLYLKGHNKLVNKYYRGAPYAKIPGTALKYEFFIFRIREIILFTLRKLVQFLYRFNFFRSTVNLNRLNSFHLQKLIKKII